MSNASNNQGRAYEFVCLNSFNEAINKIRPAKIIRNSSYNAAENAWNTLTQDEQNLYTLSAKSTIETIFALEPNIVEHSSDILNLYIQNDQHGEDADVRDIIIERKDIIWEIGLSVKHNHMAVKHSRIAKTLDFGSKWYGIPCSSTYWSDVKPIFDFLEREKVKGTLFRDLSSKEDDVYLPLLNAFVKEVSCQVQTNNNVPRRMVEYLLSKYDFYKVISIDQKTTSRNPRSTVGTVTEVYDYLRLLFARAADAYSYASGEKMVQYTDDQIIDLILKEYAGQKVLVLAPMVNNRKGHYKELFETIRRKGYLHVRVDGEVQEIYAGMKLDRYKNHTIEVVVDRLKLRQPTPDPSLKGRELL